MLLITLFTCLVNRLIICSFAFKLIKQRENKNCAGRLQILSEISGFVWVFWLVLCCVVWRYFTIGKMPLLFPQCCWNFFFFVSFCSFPISSLWNWCFIFVYCVNCFVVYSAFVLIFGSKVVYTQKQKLWVA